MRHKVDQGRLYALLLSGITLIAFGLWVRFEWKDTRGSFIMLSFGMISIVVFLYFKNPQKFNDFFKDK